MNPKTDVTSTLCSPVSGLATNMKESAEQLSSPEPTKLDPEMEDPTLFSKKN